MDENKVKIKKDLFRRIRTLKGNSKNRGITLIALVITIIILLILAGVSIATLGKNGLMENAKKAKMETMKAEVLENINTAIIGVQTDPKNIGKDVTLQIMHEDLPTQDKKISLKEYAEGAETLEGVYQYDSKNKFKFTLDSKLNIKLEAVEQGAFEVTTSEIKTSSVKLVGQVSGLKNIKDYTYVAKTSSSNKIKKEHITETSATIEGLEQDTQYDVYMIAYDNAGNEQKSSVVTIKTKALPDAKTTEGAITFGTTTWTSGSASVEISTNTEYIIEYQKNSREGTWTKGTAGTSVIISGLKHNDIIYARLTDGTSSGNYAEITITDATTPTGSITFASSSLKPGESTTATVTGTDNESGVNYTGSKYILTSSDSVLGTSDESKYTGETLSSSGTANITIGSTEGNYYLHVLLKDNAGNKTEIISGKLTVSSITYNYTATGMVEYDAGDWTQAEIQELQSKNLYNINISKSASSTSGLDFTFGGFTYKGDTSNASSIANGTITTSRNKSVAPQSGWGTPTSDGWMVLEWGETSGNKKYVKKLVSAGSPENFVYYYNNTNDAYRAEYILSGGTRQTSYKTYQARNFDMYKDTSKKNMIDEVHCMTYAEAVAVTGGTSYTDDTRRKTGGSYWLASAYNDYGLWGVFNNGDVDYGCNYCFGVRPVVSLKSGVYIDTNKHTGTGSDKYVLEMD